MNVDYRVLLLAGSATVLWGFWGFFGKVALERNRAPRSVFLAEVFTSAVCAVVLVLISPYRHGQWSADTSSWNAFGVASGVGLAIYPAVTVLLSYAFLHERPYVSQWAGIVFVIVGTILLLWGRPSRRHPKGRPAHETASRPRPPME